MGHVTGRDLWKFLQHFFCDKAMPWSYSLARNERLLFGLTFASLMTI